MAGVTGLEPAASGVTGRKEMRNSLDLPPPKDHTEPWGYAQENNGSARLSPPYPQKELD